MGTAEDVYARCTHYLHGNGPHRPRDVLAELAAEAGADEAPDLYGRGALLASFEQEVALLLGKPAACFMPSGTMAQPIALRLWAERTGRREVAFHPTCHLQLHEHKGLEHLHGLRSVLVGEPHRLMTVEDLAAVPQPLAALLVELPQREIGGLLPAWEDLVALTQAARDRGAALHLDGARLWESGPFYGRPYAEICALFDTVYVSFYKGLGGVAGAVLAGPEDLVAESRIWQRRQGGDLVRLYPYVLAARRGLREALPRMPARVAHARAVGLAFEALDGVRVRPSPPQTPMMHVFLDGDPDRLAAAALEVASETGIHLFSRTRPTEVPGWQKIEVALMDSALQVPAERFAELLALVLRRAR